MHAAVVISSELRGGAEEYLLRLYEGLGETHGFDATLFGHLEGWSPRTSRAQIDVGLGPKWSRSSAPASVRHMVRERRTALRRISGYPHPIDFYHVQFKREQILLTSALAARHPVIWTEHGTLPDSNAWSVLRPWYRRAALASSMIICVSEEVEASVIDTCGSAVRTVVIENAVDEQRFRPADEQTRRGARALLGLPPDDVVVAVVSRLHPGKRLARAITAVTPESGVTMVVAGDGPDRARLEELAVGRPVTFVGWLDKPEELYQAADVFLFGAAATEGFPTTSVLEAASTGCALAGFVGDIGSESIEECGGVLLAPGEHLGRSALTALLPNARAKAHAWAQTHTVGPWLEAHASVFESVCTAWHGAQPGFTAPEN
jgi:glycosyltransferase involved in cell wall biosynthesis